MGDFEAKLLLVPRHLVQRHAVHLNGFRKQTQLEVNVSHVDLQTIHIRKHFVLRHERVRVECFDKHLILVVQVG